MTNSPRPLQYYLPSFQASINAGAATIMESYQDLNGEAVCGSKRYLQTLLREEMGFTGVLVTDWAEIQQLNKYHKTAATPKEAVRIAIGETSIDLSMVPSDTSFFDYLVELVQEGAIPESRIDESVARILQLKEDLGVGRYFCPLLSSCISPSSKILKAFGFPPP